MHQLVHLGNSLVVLLKTANLSVQKTVLLVAHIEVLLQALHVFTKLLIFIGNLHVEILLEVQVTLHVSNFSVPKVELASLLVVILLHQGHASGHITSTGLFLFEVLLQGLDSAVKSLFVGVEGSTQRFSSPTLLLGLHFFSL